MEENQNCCHLDCYHFMHYVSDSNEIDFQEYFLNEIREA